MSVKEMIGEYVEIRESKKGAKKVYRGTVVSYKFTGGIIENLKGGKQYRAVKFKIKLKNGNTQWTCAVKGEELPNDEFLF